MISFLIGQYNRRSCHSAGAPGAQLIPRTTRISSSPFQTMSTPDALLALRNAIRSKTRITYTKGSEPTTSLATATDIVLSPTLTLPKSSPTRLRKPGTTSTDPSANPQDFYTLHAVYLAWCLRDAHGAEYLKQTRENGLPVGFISITDRKSIVDWLEGRVADLESIAPASGMSLIRWTKGEY